MKKQEVIKHFGSVAALARALDISPSAIYMWTDVPLARQYQIEVLTRGKLKSEGGKNG